MTKPKLTNSEERRYTGNVFINGIPSQLTLKVTFHHPTLIELIDTQKFDLFFYQASALKESSSTGNNVRRAIRKSPQNASMIIY